MAVFSEIEAALSLLDRFKPKNGRKEPEVEVNSLAGRFIQLFEKHGVHRNQIPSFFGHGLTYSDVENNQTLLPKLSPEILQAACDLLGVRIEWLEGVDNRIYHTHDFYKHPEEFASFLADLIEQSRAKHHQLIPRLYITTNTAKDYDALIVIEEHMYSLGDTAVRYHLCNDWVHRYWKARADLASCIATCLKQVGFMRGRKTNVAIEDFCEGKRFISDFDDLPMVFERVCPFSKVRNLWEPETWVFDPDSFIDGLEEGRFGEANALSRWLYYFDQGMMETKYAGKNPEPEFRALLDSYKSGGDLKKKDKKSEVTKQEPKEIKENKGYSKYFTLKYIFGAAFPLLLVYLAFFFEISSISDIKKLYDKYFVVKELRVYAMHPTTIIEDENIRFIPDNKDKNCKVKKTKEDNRLVLLVSCNGYIGDTIDYTVTSTNCPETRYTGFGDLGSEAEFKLQCD